MFHVEHHARKMFHVEHRDCPERPESVGIAHPATRGLRIARPGLPKFPQRNSAVRSICPWAAAILGRLYVCTVAQRTGRRRVPGWTISQPVGILVAASSGTRWVLANGRCQAADGKGGVMSLLNKNSLAATVDAVAEVFFFGRSASSAEKAEARSTTPCSPCWRWT
jgi:hypothetical protein